MKNYTKKAICILSTAAILGTGAYFGKGLVNDQVIGAKNWVNNQVKEAIVQYAERDKEWTDQKIKELVNEGIIQSKDTLDKYLNEDKKWTDQKIKEGIEQYAKNDKEWTKQKFEAKVPLDQLVTAYNSAYMILNEVYFRTENGPKEIKSPQPGTGSGILLKGGYFLTARHVTDIEFPTGQHPTYGKVEYDHSKYYLSDEPYSAEQTRKGELEKIIVGSKDTLDYTLLKVKGDVDLPFYSHGVNMPNEIKPGMKTVATGFPLNNGKYLRTGDVTQPKDKSDSGEDYISIANNVVSGDSGGPLFIIENGEVKLAGLSTQTFLSAIGMTFNGPVMQYMNQSYALKMSSIIEDMKSQLESGKLDENTAKEVKNFLDLNVK